VRRIRQSVAVAAGIGLLALIPGSALAHDPGWTLKGFGTATIDAVLTPGEWDTAAKRDFAANRLPEEGGGTMPATLYVMNDATTLYLAVSIAKPALGSSSIAFEFDNDHVGFPGTTEGDDVLLMNPTHTPSFLDEVRTNALPCPLPPGRLCGLFDTDVGGTSDGAGGAMNAGGFSVYEFSHPLNSDDDAHDFSLSVGNRIGFWMSMRFCGLTTCVDTDLPGGDPGDIVITSLNRVPPDTSITAGPTDGSFTSADAQFGFSGTDDVISASDLTFECRLDGAAFAACGSPARMTNLPEGTHSFFVRAVDEADNADLSPASRTWTVDRTPPVSTITAGPTEGTFSRSTAVDFGFAGRDNLTPSGELAFACSLDAAAFTPCTTPVRYPNLAEGRHEFAVQAVDRAGNLEYGPAFRHWTIDRTAPSRPRVRGPRRTSRAAATYRFSAGDRATPAGRLRYLCALDRKPLRPCRTRQRQRLRVGRHVLRVLAVDLAGNRSALARVRIVRTRA
jgi:hypothetical protein